MTPEERIRSRRAELKLTPSEIAAMLEISEPHVWDLDGCENEFIDTLSVSQALKYARALNLPLLTILGIDDSAVSTSPTPNEFAAAIFDLAQTSPRKLDSLPWNVSQIVSNPDTITELPIRGIMDLSLALNLDWKPILKFYGP